MKVVAEGVETQKEEDILKELHCDIGQGYLYSAAMPASDVLNWRNNETI
jgi:EAL domain-containing protein (putative c-di-GMP-specific phosphodiesterase class I)